LYLASERDLGQKFYQNVIWMSFNEIVRTMEVDGKIWASKRVVINVDVAGQDGQKKVIGL
jgi:hypothetical protein